MYIYIYIHVYISLTQKAIDKFQESAKFHFWGSIILSLAV